MNRSRTILSLLALASLSVADVLTVGPVGSGSDFDEIQLAIDAAAPGDSILVAAGLYLPFTLDKALRIVGESVESVIVGDVIDCVPTFGLPFCDDAPAQSLVAITIENVLAGTEAFVSGLTAHGYSAATAPGFEAPVVRVQSTAGTVVLHDVVLGDDFFEDPFELAVPLHMGPALGLSNAALVIVSNSRVLGRNQSALATFRGGLSTIFSHPAGPPALRAEDSTVWVVDSEVHGGDGLATSFGFGPNVGSSAVGLDDSSWYSARSSITGGKGGSSQCAFPPLNCETYDAGHAIVTAGSVLRLVGGPGNTIEGGAPGLNLGAGVLAQAATTIFRASDAVVLHGDPLMEAIVVDPSSKLVELDSSSPTIGMDSASVAPGETVTIDWQGQPNDVAGLLFALQTTMPFGLPDVDGAFAVDLVSLLFVGSAPLDGGGGASFPAFVPPLSGLIGLTGSFQGVEFHSGSAIAFTNPAPLAIR